MTPVLPSRMASYAMLPKVKATSLSMKSGSPDRRSYVRSETIVSSPTCRLISSASDSATLVLVEQPDELVEIDFVLGYDASDRGGICCVERRKSGIAPKDTENADPLM